MTELPFFDQNDEERDLAGVVRRAARAPLPKRFYEKAEVSWQDGAYVLTLDGRKSRTPARNLLSVPVEGIAKAIAAEWNAQKEVIDPSSMPFTRLTNSAIDGVSEKRAEVIEDLVRYAGSDLICYRAEGPSSLVAQQRAAWDPILTWSEQALNAKFRATVGIVHIEQPLEAVSALRVSVEAIASPFALAALHVMTTLSGSILLTLSHALGKTTCTEAWHAAHVDELFQESLWGKDEQAILRRNAREIDFRAASDLISIISKG